MSQLDPLPKDLPFRIISKTIGRGAYASIKKAVPPDQPTPVFAVKFIHKDYANRHGRVSAKQIAMEASLHAHIAQHQNIIEFFATGEDSIWRWIAMEFAGGGDLFDKIEADVGVSEDIAHFYFSQLVSGVSFMHSKGVGHRDIKPENILLSNDGNLKIADFGLACLFQYQGTRRPATTMCGSPPYIAPEVITYSRKTKGAGYAADQVDIWSCGVVLFVLLVGNTPWDEPTSASFEYEQYVQGQGRSEDELWQKLPRGAVSLLRGMMKIDPKTRFTLEEVRRHPWYTRPNSFLAPDGKSSSPLSLATKMLESLKIDFSQQPVSSQPTSQPESMDIDSQGLFNRFASTQPETPTNDILFEWEHPPRMAVDNGFSFSQPVRSTASHLRPSRRHEIWDRLSEDPSMSQFSQAPTVPLSLTQRAQKFQDIVPSYSLTRFFSHLPQSLLLPLLSESLHRLGVPVPSAAVQGRESSVAWIKVKTVDGRHCGLSGDILVERAGIHGEREGEELLEVRFVKVKGDPLEWRRFFKKVVVLCKEGIYMPPE